ncbi:MAG: anaerobic ribonucleoside-triphosphate reductase activating protein [Oscillospiraceae bacterium]
MATINIAGIANDSIVDGPGIRATIFAQGCPHHCVGCHNPETHSFGTGQERSVAELFSLVKSNPLVRGVTFSGGDPFAQSEGFTQLAILLKNAGYEIAAYTGYTYEELVAPAQRELLEHIDILIDGRFILAQRSLNLLFRGSTNQRIIDVPASLKAGTPILSTQKRWGYDNANEI